MPNYTLYHLHSDLSNCVTNVDSVTKYNEYIDAVKECGMTAMGFSEHGSVFEYVHKKGAIEAAGMKYIHAVEAYLTESLETRVRDNYHCVLIARNYDGFLELNRLISRSFNRNDNHFYYAPRISFDELFHTSENILITTACVGGVLGKGRQDTQDIFIGFLAKNKDRCYLEIGHHIDKKQVVYNQKLYELSKKLDIPLIAGTDTHVLNDEHKQGRAVLQAAKNIRFDGEDKWDLNFKTYDELVEAYKIQDSLPEAVYMEAIEETNRMADRVEPFVIDKSPKYPHIYDNPEGTFRKKVQNAIANHPYALKNHSMEELQIAVDTEIEVFKKTGSIDFMLLQTYLREWEKTQGIQCGYGRGSVSGSMVAYLLGITQMDSLRFGLNFFRFSNPSRVSLADIDTDYGEADREKVKEFLLKDRMNLPNIQSAEIITFNTIALKGAIRDVCRALYKDVPGKDYLMISNKLCNQVDIDEEKARKSDPQVFRYVDMVVGTIVSIGIHPSGVLISDLPIDEQIGLCSVSTSPYPVTMLNMKELDELMYVKLDALSLDNIGIINDTCKMLGIERLSPDNTDLEDMNVWKSIREDTTLIFQWESNSARQYLSRFMSDRTLEIARSKVKNFSMLKWMSFGNGLIRPACASFRDSVANGQWYDNGFKELNDFLAPEAGRIAMQETIMRFLVKFCGYSDAESDNVRRAIAKKKGTDKLIPEIEQRFIDYSSTHYDITRDRCEEVIKPFLQIVLDAASYGFSWNHSDAYSAIGYICGYLRYYHPLEFLTAALNTFWDKPEKTDAIMKYATKVGIMVTPPRWGLSKREYFYDADKRIIAKGLASIKYMSEAIADELYELAHTRRFDSFIDLLIALEDTALNSRQLDILIKIDFFSEFGNQRELLYIRDMFYDTFNRGRAKQIQKRKVQGTALEPIVAKYAVGATKSGQEAKAYTILDMDSVLHEATESILALKLEDLDDVTKVRNFAEVMGYAGYVSGKSEDRTKLYVQEVRPLKRRKDGKQFGYSVSTKSIGSGIESSWTISNTLYKHCPIDKGDVVLCKNWGRDGGYYHMYEYEKL